MSRGYLYLGKRKVQAEHQCKQTSESHRWMLRGVRSSFISHAENHIRPVWQTGTVLQK